MMEYTTRVVRTDHPVKEAAEQTERELIMREHADIHRDGMAWLKQDRNYTAEDPALVGARPTYLGEVTQQCALGTPGELQARNCLTQKPFIPAKSDVYNLAIALIAAQRNGMFRHAEEEFLAAGSWFKDEWLRIAQAAFNHAGYLPSIVAQREELANQQSVREGDGACIAMEALLDKPEHEGLIYKERRYLDQIAALTAERDALLGRLRRKTLEGEGVEDDYRKVETERDHLKAQLAMTERRLDMVCKGEARAITERDEALVMRNETMAALEDLAREHARGIAELWAARNRPSTDDPRYDVVSRLQYVELQGEVMELKDKLQLALNTLASFTAADLPNKPEHDPFKHRERDPRRMGPEGI